MERQRAILAEEKLERRNSILQAAHQLLIENGYNLASVSDIAKRTGLAKGTMYIYFQTKEEIYLALLEQQIDELFAVLEKLLNNTQPLDTSMVVEAIVNYAYTHPTFCNLSGMCNGILEQNLATEVAYLYKKRLADGLNSLGQSLEKRLPEIKKNQGAFMLLRSYAVILGVWQMANHSPAVQQFLHEKSLQIFRFDFVKELRMVLQKLWNVSG